jgi:hypothetical protein
MQGGAIKELRHVDQYSLGALAKLTCQTAHGVQPKTRRDLHQCRAATAETQMALQLNVPDS